MGRFPNRPVLRAGEAGRVGRLQMAQYRQPAPVGVAVVGIRPNLPGDGRPRGDRAGDKP